MHETVVDDHIGPPEKLSAAKGHEPRIARTRADKENHPGCTHERKNLGDGLGIVKAVKSPLAL